MEFEKLDAKDKAVLAELDKNSRLSYSQIARTVKLSKQSVEYRINSLLNKKILKTCTTIIDYEALGYVFYRVYYQFIGLSPDEEKKILQDIYQIPRVRRITLLDGTWDCSITILSKDPYGVRETLAAIQAKHGNKIKSKMLLISTYCEIYQHKIITPELDVIKLPNGNKIEFQLDELDKGILNELIKNSRTPLIELAAKLNTSYKVISYRIQRMEKTIIRAYDIELNLVQLGMSRYRVFVELQLTTKEKQEEITKFLRNSQHVHSFTRTIGSFDLEFNCITNDATQFHTCLTEFRSKFSELIKDYSICLISQNLAPANITQFTF